MQKSLPQMESRRAGVPIKSSPVKNRQSNAFSLARGGQRGGRRRAVRPPDVAPGEALAGLEGTSGLAAWCVREQCAVCSVCGWVCGERKQRGRRPTPCGVAITPSRRRRTPKCDGETLHMTHAFVLSLGAVDARALGSKA